MDYIVKLVLLYKLIKFRWILYLLCDINMVVFIGEFVVFVDDIKDLSVLNVVICGMEGSVIVI